MLHIAKWQTTGYSGLTTTWRYTVSIDDGEEYKVRPANLRVPFGEGKKAKGKQKQKKRGRK